MKQLDTLFDGSFSTGPETRRRTTFSCDTLSDTVRTSFGPKGRDKMIVDAQNDIVVTNDGATILRKLETSEPGAQLLATLSQTQDSLAGDGTTSVVLISAALVRVGNQLVAQGCHPVQVLEGFQKAAKETRTFWTDHLAVPITPALLKAAVLTSMASKAISAYNAHFQRLVLDIANKSLGRKVADIQVFLRAGGSIEDSEALEGFGVAADPKNDQALRRKAPVKGKLLLAAFSFKPRRLELGYKINLADPGAAAEFKDKENELPLRVIQKMQRQGVVGVVCSGTMNSEVRRHLEKTDIFMLTSVEQKRLLALAKHLDARVFGSADAYLEEEDGLGPSVAVSARQLDDGCVVLFGAKTMSAVLRGPNEAMLKEVERSIHDALSVAMRLQGAQKVLPGGGSVEAATAAFLESVALTYHRKWKEPIRGLGEALLEIPFNLAENAGLDTTQTVYGLLGHYSQAIDRNSNPAGARLVMKGVGLSRKAPVLEDAIASGVVEPLAQRLSQLTLCLETAVSLLRIDASLLLNPKKQQQVPRKHH